jgi:DNA-binding transcriptional LysR family regulator
MKLDPVSLRVFVAVVEEGTIAAGAQREHLVAAAASKRISELEAQLGTALLVRTNRGVHPTAAGHSLAVLARQALAQLDQVGARLLDYATGIRGTVRIHANPSAICQFLPGELKGFFNLYPDIHIDLEEQVSDAIVEAVLENRADIGVVNEGHDLRGLTAHPYRHYRLVVAVPMDHPLARRQRIAFEEALPFDLVGLHTGSSLNLLLTRAAAALKMPLKQRIQVRSYEALCLMVDTGLGIGVLPEAVARLHAQGLGIHLLHLDEPWAQRSLVLCVRPDDRLDKAGQRLLDHLRRPASSPGA